MHHKKFLRIGLAIIDACLLVIVILAAKNLITTQSNLTSSFAIDLKEPLTKFPEVSIIPQVTLLSSKAQNVSQITPKNSPLLDLINSSRKSNSLQALILDSSISQVAQNHSIDMSKRNFFSHTNPDGKDPFQRLSVAGISFQSAGENIAYAPTIEVAHQNLMASKEHRDNILNPSYKKIGLGVFKESSTKLLITEVFTN